FRQFFYNSDLTDYEVSEITSVPIEGPVGVYDEGGKKMTHSEKSTKKAFAKNKDKRYRSTVTLQRLGEALAPVDVVVHFDNGEAIHEQWDGQYRWIKYVY